MVSGTINTGSLNFEAFIAGYLDDVRYELIDGELIDLKPTGLHEQVVGLINRKLNVAIDLLNLPWVIPMKCLIKPLGQNSAFRPDVVILDQTALANEPFWKTEPVITLGKSVKLVVEVVSTNWQNDYARKVEDYEALGIPEYWIADYLGLGGKRYIGLLGQWEKRDQVDDETYLINSDAVKDNLDEMSDEESEQPRSDRN